MAKPGLFEVTDGICQVRGMDIAIMTIVEADTGVIVIDPLLLVREAVSDAHGGCPGAQITFPVLALARSPGLSRECASAYS